VIVRNGVKVFTIFTRTHFKRRTDLEYRVEPLGLPGRGYIIDEVVGQTDWGDGTVPFESARGNPTGCKENPILNVTHAFLCNDRKVIELLPGLML